MQEDQILKYKVYSWKMIRKLKKIAIKLCKRVDLNIERSQIASYRGVLSKIKFKMKALSWQGFLYDQTFLYNCLWYIIIKLRYLK